MTLVPECQLAREAQMCYASISTVTDYDVWADKPVTAKEVLETLSKNVKITKKILTELIDKIPKTELVLVLKHYLKQNFSHPQKTLFETFWKSEIPLK